MINNNEILISIIIPVYNGEKYLSRCLDSILSQRVMHQIEIIVVDDGSTDSTLEICDFYAEHDSRVKIIHQNNSGVSSSRNNGLSLAIGTWIMFVDADDYLYRNSLCILERYLIETEADIIQCKLLWNQTEDNSTVINKMNVDPDILQNIVLNRMYYEKKFPDYACRSTQGVYGKCFRLKFLQEYGAKFDESLHLGEDMIFYLEVLEYTKNTVLVLSLLLYIYCVVQGSCTRKYNPKLVKSTVNYAEKIYHFAKKNHKSDEFYQNMYYQICEHIRVGLDPNVYQAPDWETKYSMTRYVMDNDVIQVSIEQALHKNQEIHNLHWIRRWGGMWLLHFHLSFLYILFQIIAFKWGTYKILFDKKRKQIK